VTHAHAIEIVPSTQVVTVSYKGVVLAETKHALVLREGRLPPRYYIPEADVRMELLTPTSKHTVCPFKGTASYWSVRVGDELLPDLVWSYPDPIPDATEIAGMLCFYNERVEIDASG
jgi:uncharacterized protein (DUF427 family)